MQLAQSTSLPADSNLAALLFPSATLAAGPTPTNMPCGVLFEGGFDTLLPEAANLPVASVCPAVELPIDLRGGVPLAFMPGPAAGVGSPIAIAKPGLTVPISEFEGVEPLESDAPVDATKVAPRASSRSVRLTSPRLGPDLEFERAVESPPDRPSSVVAVAQLGFVPVVPHETALLGEDLVAETAEEPPMEESSTEEDTLAQHGGSASSSLDTVAVVPTQAGTAKRPAPEAAESQLPPAFEPRHPISAATHKPEFTDSSEKTPSQPQGFSPVITGSADVNTAAIGQSSAVSEEQFTAGLAFTDTSFERGLNLPRRGWEKNAVPRRLIGSESSEQIGDAVKSFVTPDKEVLASRVSSDGTEVANREFIMPAFNSSSQTPQLKNEAAPAMVAATSGLAERVESHNVLALALDGVSSAHEAVEVVLRTADRLSSLVHKSVRLEFAVGGEKLDVRVELRANEVLTTFHTESAELRSALASEWQGVTASAGQGERTLRILPAQFGSSEQNAANSFSGDASSRHREPQHQAQSDTPRIFGSGVRGRSGRGILAAAEAPALETSFAAPGTALHLHTLA